MTEAELAAHHAAALAFLEARGCPTSLVVLGIVSDEPGDEGYAYETHVGPTDRPGTAALVTIVAQDMYVEAQRQGQVLYDPECCPVCDSPRYGNDNKPDPVNPYKIVRRRRCMACGHEVFPDR